MVALEERREIESFVFAAPNPRRPDRAGVRSRMPELVRRGGSTHSSKAGGRRSRPIRFALSARLGRRRASPMSRARPFRGSPITFFPLFGGARPRGLGQGGGGRKFHGRGRGAAGRAAAGRPTAGVVIEAGRSQAQRTAGAALCEKVGRGGPPCPVTPTAIASLTRLIDEENAPAPA